MLSIHRNSVLNEQMRTLALLQAGSREDIAKELLEIALRSQTSADAVRFKEDGQCVSFAVSSRGEATIRTARDSSILGSVLARMSAPIRSQQAQGSREE
jgi:hypothetical protein